MDKNSDKYDVMFYEVTDLGLYVKLKKRGTNKIYFYYETLGEVDITDGGAEFIGGHEYEEIYDYIQENCNSLINLFDEPI